MKLRDELTEHLINRAMSGPAIVEYWQARARCCRCRKYDKKWRRCNSAQMVGGAYIEYPADFGCVHFSD